MSFAMWPCPLLSLPLFQRQHTWSYLHSTIFSIPPNMTLPCHRKTAWKSLAKAFVSTWWLTFSPLPILDGFHSQCPVEVCPTAFSAKCPAASVWWNPVVIGHSLPGPSAAHLSAWIRAPLKAVFSSWPSWHRTVTGFPLNSLILLPFCGCLLHSVSKHRSSPGLEAGALLLLHLLTLWCSLRSPRERVLDLMEHHGRNDIFIHYSLSPPAKAPLSVPIFACLAPLCNSDMILNISSERRSLTLQFKVAVQSLFSIAHHFNLST